MRFSKRPILKFFFAKISWIGPWISRETERTEAEIDNRQYLNTPTLIRFLEERKNKYVQRNLAD